MGDRSPHPSKDAWEAVRHDIHRWYLRENLTCEKIKGLLRDRGFCVSERQIKNRLSEWKFERKKTPHQHYLAMSVVAYHYSTHGTEIEFSVPKREERVAYSVQKVKKECERVQKRSRDRHENIKLPSFFDARSILESNKIFFAPKYKTIPSPHTWHQTDHSWNEAPQYRESSSSSGICSPIVRGLHATHIDTKSPPPGYYGIKNYADTTSAAFFSVLPLNPWTGNNNLPVESNVRFGSSSSSIDTSGTPLNIKIEPPLSEQNHLIIPASVVNDASYRLSTPNGPDYGHDDKPNRGIGLVLQSVPIAQPSSTKMEPSSPSSHIIPSPPSRSICSTETESSTVSDETDVWCPCPAQPRHIDYDFTEPIMQVIESFASHRSTIQQDESSFPKLLHGPSGPSGAAHKTRKEGVSTWAAHYYMTCFSKNVHEDALKASKDASMEALKSALKLERMNNHWILPCLNWTVLVLGTTMKKIQLADLLNTTCHVINEQTDLHGGPMYEVVFRYVWAWASTDDDRVRHYGNLLMRKHDDMRELWPGDNPNFLVCSFLCAFHAIKSQDNRRAIQILTDCMPISQRVMGDHDLLTINCLAIASRANAEIGNWGRALHHLKDAMEAARFLEAAHSQVEAHRPVLQNFRLQLLDRHAELMLHVFQGHLAAEKQFWRVLQIRALLDGFNNAKTLWAAQKLQEIFQRTGRTALWEGLKDYIDARQAWEHERDWCRERGRTPPPPPRPENHFSNMREAHDRHDIRTWLNIMDSRALAS